MALRTVVLIVLSCAFAQFAFAQTLHTTDAVATSKLYAGKTADQWVSEIVRLALSTRIAEEDYEQSLRECAKLGATKEDKAPPCVRANDAYNKSLSARKEYQQILNTVSGPSLPVEWLKAHFTWVRFASEWKRE